MDTDTPQGEPGDLNMDTAAEAFGALLDAPSDPEITVDTEIDPPKKQEQNDAPKGEEAKADEAKEGDDAPITIEVDGKQVTLTKAELAEAYKSGLRQSDYTQKTMAVAEQRKAAEAEVAKASQERAVYAQNLGRMQAQLEGALQQQAQIDWNALLESDPVEFLKQKHLYDQRQVALGENLQQQQLIAEQQNAENQKAAITHLQSQQQELLAKLPEWKDEAKAKAERDAIKGYLREQGYSPDDVSAISDHRAVLLSRKAMLYDQMMAKASAAAKKVANLPTRVERPGVTGTTGSNDGRSAAMRAHAKSGTLESAAEAFAQLL